MLEVITNLLVWAFVLTAHAYTVLFTVTYAGFAIAWRTINPLQREYIPTLLLLLFMSLLVITGTWVVGGLPI